MRATYGSVLRQPGVPRLVISALLARIPVGINALAVVLLVRRTTGSFVDAGVVDGALAIGAVLITPGQGRLIDRFGQPRVLIPSALISAAALIGLDLAADRHAGIVALTVLAAVGGGSLPPVSASMRALWADLIPEADRRDTAFAFEAVVTEVVFIAGPLLTALIVAVATPSVAVITSACLTLAGTAAFATSPSPRRWRAVPSKRTLAGPLAAPGVRTLVLSIVPMGLAFGTLEVAMPALATRHGDPAAAGLLLAAFCAGSLVGGLLYGARRWRGSLGNRYVLLNAAFAAGMAPLIVAGAIPVMILLMALAGFSLAPATACAFALIDDVAPPGTTTEAFTWLFTANMLGAAAGATAAGALIHSAGLRAALLMPVCGVGAAFLLALARRRTLSPPLAGMAGVTPEVARVPATAVGAAATAVPPAQRMLLGDRAANGVAGHGARAPRALAAGMAVRMRDPVVLAAGLVFVAAMLGYRGGDERPDPHRRSRRG